MRPLLASNGLGWTLIAEVTTYLRHKTQIISGTSDLKASFLWSSFHGSRTYYSIFWQEDSETVLLSNIAPMAHGNDLHDKICIKV